MVLNYTTECSVGMIHSGHFMISSLTDESSDTDTTISPRVDPSCSNSSCSSSSCAAMFPPQYVTHNNNNNSTTTSTICLSRRRGSCSESHFIDASLRKLLECMSLDYFSGKLPSPKWKNFNGIKVKIKDKIRINNIIWREWYRQFKLFKSPVVCQFEMPLCDQIHTRPEAVVLEGKYWKRRLESVATEYKKGRRFYQQRVTFTLNDYDKHLMDEVITQADLLDRSEAFNVVGAGTQTADIDSKSDLTGITPSYFSTFYAPMPATDSDNKQSSTQRTIDEMMDTLEPLPSYQQLLPRSKSMFSGCTSSILTAILTDRQPLTKLASFSFLNDKSLPLKSVSCSVEAVTQTMSALYSNASSGAVTQTINSNAVTGAMTQTDCAVKQTTLSPYINTTYSPYSSTCDMSQTYRYDQQSAGLSNSFKLHNIDTCCDFRVPEYKETGTSGRPLQYSTGCRPTQYGENGTSCRPMQYSMGCKPAQYGETSTSCRLPQYMESGTSLTFDRSLLELSPEDLTVKCSSSPDASLFDMSTGYQPIESPEQQEYKTECYQPLEFCYQSGTSYQPSERHEAYQPIKRRVNMAGYQARDCQPIECRTNVYQISERQPPDNYQSGETWPSGISAKNIKRIKTLMLEQRSLRRASTGSLPPGVATFHQLSPRTSGGHRHSTGSRPSQLSHNMDTAQQHTTLNNSTLMLQQQLTPDTVSSAQSTDSLTNLSFGSFDSTPNDSKVSSVSLESDSLHTNKILGGRQYSPTIALSRLTRSRHGSTDLSNTMYDNLPCHVVQQRLEQTAARQQQVDQRRELHLSSEKKRRTNIKNGLQKWDELVASLTGSAIGKSSKASILRQAVNLFRQLSTENERLEEEIISLTAEKMLLQSSIDIYCRQLPSSGVEVVVSPRCATLRRLFSQYISHRAPAHWKFCLFIMLMRQLFETFVNRTSVIDTQSLAPVMIDWIDVDCPLMFLRKLMQNELLFLLRRTSVMDLPTSFDKFQQELVQLAINETFAYIDHQSRN